MPRLSLVLLPISLIGCVSSLAVADAKRAEAPAPGYTVEDFEWEVQYKPDEPAITLNGTVEQVYAQLIELNPSYDADMAEIVARQVSEPAESSLEKREHTICDNYPLAIRVWIQEGIKYLRGVPGRPTRGPGPGSCGRVSCSFASAIWFCNDNNYQFTLSSFNTIADAATVIVRECQSGQGYPDVAGQRFHNNGWNAIVREGSC